eukprot:750264-Hanusia_phi.AAC.1
MDHPTLFPVTPTTPFGRTPQGFLQVTFITITPTPIDVGQTWGTCAPNVSLRPPGDGAPGGRGAEEEEKRREGEEELSGGGKEGRRCEGRVDRTTRRMKGSKGCTRSAVKRDRNDKFCDLQGTGEGA